RVPMIVRGPGIQAGSAASGYVYLMDVFPTLCDLAGITIPDAVEGKSFRPVLENRTDRIRDVLYGVYCGGTKPGMRAVKTAGWKLIEYDVLDGQVRRTQLFDIKNNPNEWLLEHHDQALAERLGIAPNDAQINLAESPSHASKRRELEQLLEAEMKRWADPYQLTARANDN
ncbi:MAG: sulfatase, partial [Pirellulales bacterium]|nr:sulfatase [Pirellulales bacterium]